MREVAVGFIYDHHEERLLTAQRLDHTEEEVELLGGVKRMGEAAPCALDRALKAEIDGRVNLVGQITTWRTLHRGEPTSFNIFHVELQTGNIHVREEETHSDLAWRSVRELRRMTLAPALGQVVKWLDDGELESYRSNGQRLWRMAAPSGITEVS